MKIYTYEGVIDIGLGTQPELNEKSIAGIAPKAKAILAQSPALSEDMPLFREEFWQRENYDHSCIRVNACDPSNKAAVEKYIAATLKLKTLKGRKHSVYDELVAIHLGVVGLDINEDGDAKKGLATGKQAGKNGSHDGPAFLPWHRQYLKVFEAALREIDPDVAIPFWDWTDHKGTQTLFGESLLGQFVDNAAFFVDRDLHYYYKTSDYISEDGKLVRLFGRGGPHALKAPMPTTEKTIQTLMQEKSYGSISSSEEPRGYWNKLESGEGLHGKGHMWIGGSMSPMSSPNDPAFWMHHANVDRLWAQWQLQQRRAGAAAGAYDFADHYYKSAASLTTHGHDPDTLMWPWDANASKPAQYLPDQFFPGNVPPSYERLFRSNAFPQHYELPSFTQKVLVKDVLDPTKIGPEYDGLNYSNPRPMT